MPPTHYSLCEKYLFLKQYINAGHMRLKYNHLISHISQNLYTVDMVHGLYTQGIRLLVDITDKSLKMILL